MAKHAKTVISEHLLPDRCVQEEVRRSLASLTRALGPCFARRFEPWTIVNRKLAHWHDVRFRGYGQNKIQHIANMNATGFKFVVHPQAFIVHRSHPETPMR